MGRMQPPQPFASAARRGAPARRTRHVTAGLLLAIVACGTGAVLGPAPAWAGTTVQVQPGQDLYQLARANHTTVAALAAANGIANPNVIVAGTELLIPGPEATDPASGGGTIVVRRGQDLWSIARQLGTTVAALAAANGITDPNRVRAGAVLEVPGGQPAMSLASYSTPLPPSATSSGLPQQLVEHPGRLALQPLFTEFAADFDVPAPLLEAMCWWESGWQPSVVSPTGAIGVGQLEPATVDFVTSQLLDGEDLDPYVASDNIEMSAAFLGYLLAQTGGNQQLALAGYYQGLRSVRADGVLPTTAQYVSGIMAYTAAFGG